MREAQDGKVWATLTREAVLRPKAGGDQNLPVRFWIITMMLVLFGLPMLKLR